jgi:hypothetical protein
LVEVPARIEIFSDPVPVIPDRVTVLVEPEPPMVFVVALAVPVAVTRTLASVKLIEAGFAPE